MAHQSARFAEQTALLKAHGRELVCLRFASHLLSEARGDVLIVVFHSAIPGDDGRVVRVQKESCWVEACLAHNSDRQTWHAISSDSAYCYGIC